MAINRYVTINDSEVNVSGYLYRAVEKKLIDVDTVISEEGKRLDHYAFEYYEDADDWWVIAAASGIGWWLQIPAGIVLSIPNNPQQVQRFIDNLES